MFMYARSANTCTEKFPYSLEHFSPDVQSSKELAHDASEGSAPWLFSSAEWLPSANDARHAVQNTDENQPGGFRWGGKIAQEHDWYDTPLETHQYVQFQCKWPIWYGLLWPISTHEGVHRDRCGVDRMSSWSSTSQLLRVGAWDSHVHHRSLPIVISEARVWTRDWVLYVFSRLSEVFWEVINSLVHLRGHLLRSHTELLQRWVELYTRRSRECRVPVDQCLGFLYCSKIRICLPGSNWRKWFESNGLLLRV